MVYDLKQLRDGAITTRQADDGTWQLAKPLPFYSFLQLHDLRERLRAAWAVLRGRACAVRWE